MGTTTFGVLTDSTKSLSELVELTDIGNTFQEDYTTSPSVMMVQFGVLTNGDGSTIEMELKDIGLDQTVTSDKSQSVQREESSVLIDITISTLRSDLRVDGNIFQEDYLGSLPITPTKFRYKQIHLYL